MEKKLFEAQVKSSISRGIDQNKSVTASLNIVAKVRS